MSVLVVDDNPANVALLAAILSDIGVQRVHASTDPRRVAGLLPELNPDLILLDLHMPHLDGHQVLEQVVRFAGGRYLPVLVLTADATSDARDRALAHGARDFLTKPFDNDEAALRIANLLETRQLYAALRGTGDSDLSLRGYRDAELGRTHERVSAALRDTSAFAIAYQPVLDLATLEAVGHEALSRFSATHPRGPAGWFSDAFDVGLGIDLEQLAVVRALPFLRWAGGSDDFLAVNMSPASVLALPGRHVFPSELCPRLVVELTEHVPIEDYSAIHRALAQPRDAGLRIAADDLGAGYAGFRHLVSLEPDIIKLDISLVTGLDRSSTQRALASALVAFARDVGAVVVAEGIETSAELAVLQDLGVSWGQGYYLGRPKVMAESSAASAF